MSRASKAKAADRTHSQIEPFCGVAYTFQASKDQGFQNFRICMLFVVDGEIVHIEKSQPYASFEAIAKAEVLLGRSGWNLASRFADGVTAGMGGENRDEIVNRLKKKNPELLDRIAPALGLPRKVDA